MRFISDTKMFCLIIAMALRHSSHKNDNKNYEEIAQQHQTSLKNFERSVTVNKS
jgi:hypothetical protein